MIVARMKPEDAASVAQTFGRHDGTTAPYEIGVLNRSLYRFHDLYFHLVDFARPVPEAMATAQSLPAFREMSEDLKPFITAYDPAWRSPADAMAQRFYHWSATTGRSPEPALPAPTARAV